MKFTNVKQLIIKFMGGGLINFPTRFLRWVKINGDSDDGGSGESNSDILFKIATIQPTKYSLSNEEENFILYDVKDLNYDIYKTYEQESNDIVTFVFTKEEISKLGFDLTELEQLPILDITSEIHFNNTNSILIDNSIIQNNFIPNQIKKIDEYTTGVEKLLVQTYPYRILRTSYNNDDNLYLIWEDFEEH